MRRSPVLVLTAVAVMTVAWAGLYAAAARPQAAAPAQASATPSATVEHAATINKYCVSCHSERLKTGNLALDAIDWDHVAAHADVWEKVIQKVRVGMMPPPGSARPDEAARTRLVAFLQTTIDRAAVGTPNPGRPLVRRLNRTEYANAVRDLLALDVDASSLLPPDDAAFGFDNVADVLGVSPTLLERYLAAAGKVSSLAVGDPTVGAAGEVFRVRQDASQDVHIEGTPLGTVGGLLAKVTLPLNGQYVLASKLYRTNLGAMRGLEYEHQLEYTVDGARVHLAKMGGQADFKASLVNVTEAGNDVDHRTETRIPLTAGPHEIGVAFLQRTDGPNPLRLQPFVRSSNDTLDTTGHPHIDMFSITGPFDPTGPGDTPSRRQIFTCRPAKPAEETPCARTIITTLARRAYRGQESKEDIERLLTFYRTAREHDGDFERGILMAVRRILASPKFVLRVEDAQSGVAPGVPYRVSDLELATRLSFFLWSSIPDDQLLELARQGRLKSPAVLAQQVKRMLADPKSAAFVNNFAGQWLYVRNLKNIQPNSNEFPDFDDNLRQALGTETLMFFESVLREDRNTLDLMTADYTFVNERLAKHYGIPNVYGSHFRRVTLADDARRGLLGKGAVLMVTSHADRTSPVVRGKWILENLLSAPPPPPPPNVPPLKEENIVNGRVLTMRERMEDHRKNPVCSSCHSRMDPIGLAMENFDAVGTWRTKDGGTNGTPIDASGQLMDGTTVDGVVSLRRALVRQPEIFVGNVAEKLLTYALGRGLESYDMPTVRAIARDAAKHDYRFSSLLMGVINSAAFQMKVNVAQTVASAPARAAH